MFKKLIWLLCLTTTVLAKAGAPEILRDSSFLRLLNKHYSSVHTPRTQWSYEDFHRHQTQPVSHASHAYEPTLGATQETSSDHPGFSSSSQEYWRPSSANSNFTGAGYYGYSGSHLGVATFGDGSSYQDFKQASHQFQQMRPAASGHVSVKNTPLYYAKGNLQNLDASGKSKYKKTTWLQTPSGHKKISYPRVHRPYAKHKYPTRKTVHPLYRNYYQSAYQRYPIPSRETQTPRYKLKAPAEGHNKASTASPSLAAVAQRHHTTERMDDAHPEGSSAAEDYSAYNDTHRGSGGYYETYEEVDKTTSEPEESSYDENTTRGYYGDRIYMSTQVPLPASPERAAVKNKYFIVRRTAGDEDIETIFE